MGSQVSGDRVQERQRSGITEAGTDENHWPWHGRQSEDLTTQDSVTGSNIAPVNDPQLERISLNQTHPHTDTCTHTHTTERGWDREPMNRDINNLPPQEVLQQRFYVSNIIAVFILTMEAYEARHSKDWKAKMCSLWSIPWSTANDVMESSYAMKIVQYWSIYMHIWQKPSFGVKKNYCQDLLNTRSGKLALKRHGHIFATHLIEYAFVGVSLSICKFMGGEYLNESHNVIY